MFENIKADARKYYIIDQGIERPNVKSKINVIAFNYGLHSLAVFRFGKWIESLRKSLFFIKVLLLLTYHCLNFLTTTFYGIRISRKASIGKGFYIGHFGGIDIGPCLFGVNCSIHQQVKVGNFGNTPVPPAIGNNVWIGPNAKVRRGITIGDNVTIAAGVEATSDIMASCLLIGQPSIIIKNYNNTYLLGVKNEKLTWKPAE